jgi:2-polyprenyl-6-methoxyphenol hydroxylase-like FAD-dependent oxidoreductase
VSGIRVLVAGASAAGPALAHWLRRRGAEVQAERWVAPLACSSPRRPGRAGTPARRRWHVTRALAAALQALMCRSTC